MPMPSGRKIRPPIQAPLTTPPSTLTFCGLNNNNGRYFGGSPGRGSSVTPSPHTQPQARGLSPTASQPPLITDTLTACLDVNGTYICTSYSPRCYIIQKVTANSLRVSPSPAMISSGGGAGGGSGTIGPPPGLCHPSQVSKYPNSGSRPTTSQGQGQSSSCSGGGGETSPRQSSKGTLGGSGAQFEIRASPQGPITSQKGGNNYMSCEVGVSTTGVGSLSVTEERGRSPMGVVSQQCSLNSAPYINDSRNLNGMRDGSGLRDDTMSESDTRGSRRGEGVALQGLINNNERTSTDPTSNGELRHMVLTQLEYYFSPDNLSTDKFLVSQMDSDQYVYISTIANFNMMKKLSSDLDLITDVLRESKNVQVHPDGKRVRPVSNRTMVILRGIPDSTPIEEIKALFEKENSPRCNHCELAFNDSWYLSFDSDDEAIRAHRYLREEVREFKGQPIMARIKSRPTTLLGPGVGMNPTKNGYHQPSVSLPTFISSPFVPVTQTGGSTATVATTPIYPTPQQVSSAVFTMPTNPYGSFGAQLPWAANFYDLNSPLTPIYMNGIPSQNSPYPKSAPPQMLPRHRSSKSESESFNCPPLLRGGQRRMNGNNGAGDTGMVNGIHIYNSRKTNSSHGIHGHGTQPAPLLAMPPTQVQLTNHISSHNQSHNHHSSSHNSAPPMNNSAPAAAINRNGHLHYSSLPPQSVPHVHSAESFHRPYRGGDNRPRSSLGVRRGPPRTRDDEGTYEGNNQAPVAPSSTRGVPSNRGTAPPPPPSPQPTTPQVTGTNQTASQTTGRNKFDLEVSSFPPLPGAANPANKNGDSPYEGRLSDVVKGVKSLKVSSGSGSMEKEEGLPRAGGSPTNANPSTEIVVSMGAESSTSAIYVVSAASPTREVEGVLRDKGTDPSSPPSQVSATTTTLVVHGSKKEFREVGVGSADDNQEIRASSSKECVVSGTKVKETADKSTQSVLVKTASTSTVPTTTHTKPFSGATENTSKRGPPRTEEDSGAGKKELISGGETGKKPIDEDCSTEDRDREGPVRLSYAQVAQRSGSGIEKSSAPPNVLPSTSAMPAGDEGKKTTGGRGNKETKEGVRGQLNSKQIPPGPSSRNAFGSKRPPFPNNRRDRISSNGGNSNRTGSSPGGEQPHRN